MATTTKYLDSTGLTYYNSKLQSQITDKLDTLESTLTTNLSADMAGASSSAAGTHGLVPAPAAGKQAAFLRGDGTWATPTNTTYSTATSAKDGLMSKTDKAKLDAFGTADTYALKTDITGVYKYKGSVASTSALPTSGNTTGDVYNTEDTGMNYAWNGSEWDALGEIFEIDAITTTEIDAMFA